MPMKSKKKSLMSNRTSYRCLKKWQKMANFRHLFLKKSEQLFAAVPGRPIRRGALCAPTQHKHFQKKKTNVIFRKSKLVNKC